MQPALAEQTEIRVPASDFLIKSDEFLKHMGSNYPVIVCFVFTHIMLREGN